VLDGTAPRTQVTISTRTENSVPHVSGRTAVSAGALVLGALLSTAATAQQPDPSVLVSTGWLAQHRSDRTIVVLVVDRGDSAYRAGHVPGARFMPYAALGQTVNGISLELPSPDSLRTLFESAGISSATHVVLTGRPLTVTRAFFTLAFLGFRDVSALDGGFTKWKREEREVERSAPAVERGHIVPVPHPEIVARARWVLDRIGKPGFSLVDTRTDSEYIGIGQRGGLRSTGHLAGARRFEWQDAFTDTNDFTPRSMKGLRALWRQRVAPGDTVIAYCYIGYRASGSWFISRLLGYPVKLYDGSYEEWARLAYPTVTAPTPLRGR
jgi:thiosulfate/3-mercaptopyruvate sulfurtransferase